MLFVDFDTDSVENWHVETIKNLVLFFVNNKQNLIIK